MFTYDIVCEKLLSIERVSLSEQWLELEWWLLSCAFESDESLFGAVYTHKVSMRSGVMSKNVKGDYVSRRKRKT